MARDVVMKLVSDIGCGELDAFRCLCAAPGAAEGEIERRIRELAALSRQEFRIVFNELCKWCPTPGSPGASPPAAGPAAPGSPTDGLSRLRDVACSPSARLARTALSGAIQAARVVITDPNWVRALDAAVMVINALDAYCSTADMPASRITAMCSAWAALKTITVSGDTSVAGTALVMDALRNLMGSELGGQIDAICQAGGTR